MKFIFYLFGLLFYIAPSIGQSVMSSGDYNPLQSPNTFRSKSNPEYWQNRKPYEGYWQQDVQYKIKASIDEKTNIIDGQLELTYWNNSPDKLEYVYFHLYQNAFQPDSYYDNLQKNNNVKPKYGKYEKNKLGTTISSLTIKGKEARTELDNTILKVYLPENLKSGESLSIKINFKTYFDNGGVRRRMKVFNSWGYKHYDGVHWYPRISVYDHKFGWTKDQHLGHEFYGDFGSFDVELTFASNFVVGATGFLINRAEVLPGDLRSKLDIKNFAEKPWNSRPSIITPYDSTQRKTWKYHAENVHDFAFTADPTYRIGEANWEGVTCYSLAQEPHASKWQNAAEYAAKVVKVFSEDFGRYVYHKMIVADARDGMEYPMLTLDGGSDPGYRGLFAHEIGHNWFFGQVGNNETYRAALDEGFTQFLTYWGQEKIDGKYPVKNPPRSAYRRWFTDSIPLRNKLYSVYLSTALKGSNTKLNTHSDAFNGALRHGGGYRQVYYKTATMLYNLQYVLGDELFLNAMKHYFNQWKICHPYVNDFRNSIIQYTKVDLNWFFDQWLETPKEIDYEIGSIKKGKEQDEYLINFKRSGRMQMPLDFEIVTKTGEKHDFHIPNTWFLKETNATVLPKWHGWDKLQPVYQAKVTVPGKLKSITIDPTNRLADMNMLNNSKLINPLGNFFSTKYNLFGCITKTRFDSKVSKAAEWTNYEQYVRPDLWYNAYDGIKIGYHMNGHYMNYKHIYDATVWYNSGYAQGEYAPDLGINTDEYDRVSYRLNYKTATDKFIKGSQFQFGIKSLDGLEGLKIGIEKSNESATNKLYANFQSLYRNDSTDLNYLLFPDHWGVDKYNNFVNIGIRRKYKYSYGVGNIHLGLRSTAIGSDYNYANIHLTVVNRNKIGKIAINTRTFFQFGTGDNWAPESELFLAGANPENLMQSKFTRANFVSNNDWTEYRSTTNNFHAGGGLNLRGYAGYYVAQANKGDTSDIRIAYKGNSGASFNAELEYDKLLGIRLPSLGNALQLKSYLFADVGLINYNTIYEDFVLTDIRADAGAGFALTIKKWGPLDMAKPITIRYDMPFFLNRPPSIDDDFIQFRWIVGISRAF